MYLKAIPLEQKQNHKSIKIRTFNERHVSNRHGKTQYSKLLSEIPQVDIVITMGCNVNCPAIPCEYREDWGLSDPTGKNDVEFSKVIHSIHTKILELTEKIKKDELISKKI